MKNRIIWWGLVVLWCAAIFTFTASPTFTGESTKKFIDQTLNSDEVSVAVVDKPIISHNKLIRKSAHFTVFAILAFLLWKALEGARLSYLLAWCGTTLYAVTDELHQSFVPGRSALWLDVVIDSLGALTCLVILFFFTKKRGVV
ncbi:VanZ family protein [Bacillus sp. HMF5848]|uniref:VanZ family protein n=1 Tax=Bacillus sp. HMF5848 TaxID=2495421 RepID=UPI000F7B5638|nr:VanZ family protein [Bacillus sp. HMF5848]RSK28851.1 VanZ family protein [Bacillus sp. HMF5848]